jgi:uncharacterized RDD family membrane protein YckC
MAQTIFCWRCGQSMQSDAVFCQKCGAPVTPAAAPVATAVATPSNVPAAPVAAPMPVVAAYQPYGGFWIRVLAYMIDRLIVGVAFVPVWIIFGVRLAAQLQHLSMNGTEEVDFEQLLPVFHFLSIVIPLALIVQWLYEALLTSSSWQATIGKRLLNLKVTDEAGIRISFGRASGRYFAKILSNLIFSIGFIMVAFTARKQGLHDMIAGTLVMKTNP